MTEQEVRQFVEAAIARIAIDGKEAVVTAISERWSENVTDERADAYQNGAAMEGYMSATYPG